MSDSKKNPKNIPPDDYSKTTPNINLEEDDWSETNTAADTPDDDWGKTVINYNVREEHEEPQSFGEEQHPSPKSPEVDWGMTQTNANSDEDFGGAFQSVDDDVDGKTVPYFRLPEVDQKKYQNIPPTPTEKAAKEERSKEGGIPLWFWGVAGIMTIFAFSVVVFLGIWFFLLGSSGFEVVIAGAKPGSRFTVEGGEVGIESEEGKYRLKNLRPGKRQINIINESAECTPNPLSVEGVKGESVLKFVSCRSKAIDDECSKTRDIGQRAKCAGDALDNLGNPPDLDALLDALNLLIINFASGSSEIPRDKRPILQKAATKINQLPERVVIEVGGHTDNVGSDSNNQKLSERRGNAVRDALIGYGVRQSALISKGYGETQHIADNSTEKGRFDNRRIQYTAAKR